VVAAFGQILPQAVLDIPRHGCINIHPSLLPRFRGASPVAAAILAGDEFTGVSIMLMDKGLDTGAVLARAAVAISPQDNTGLLTLKLSQVAARVLQEVLVRWLRGEIIPQPQKDDRSFSHQDAFEKKRGAPLPPSVSSFSKNPICLTSGTPCR
jgi:methionyl-tRNA formyltransferase